MDRMACVDLPAFPLQLLMQNHPHWRKHPVVVVEDDKPQGKILWVNERARGFRILPGMNYAAGLSLTADLRAAVVSPSDIERAVKSLHKRLHRFTPHVEAATEDPGVFWLDAAGLERLHRSLAQWAGKIRSELKRSGFESGIAVGFSRFNTYALARSRRGVLVLGRPDDENSAARRVTLDRLAFEPSTRNILQKLGIHRIGEFLDLPADGIGKRFGDEARRLHRMASGALQSPLQSKKPEVPVFQRQLLEHPETKTPRLLHIIEQKIEPLLQTLADKGHALSLLHLGFRFEKAGDHIERLRPAAPTLDADQLLELIRLRLEAVRELPDAVIEIRLVAGSVAASREQLQLFAQSSRRDPAAANRALARLRAELGNAAVIRPRLREGHLPEARFDWEPVNAVREAKPRDVDHASLVRRVYDRPRPLPRRQRREPDGWMLRGLQRGPVVRMQGPYIVSGGWWQRKVHREYHFAETQKGDLLWVYYDRGRRRWYLHGRVE